jgi:L-ascorbate metabolism protein UlaG (beta-lactamase superfamily)
LPLPNTRATARVARTTERHSGESRNPCDLPERPFLDSGFRRNDDIEGGVSSPQKELFSKELIPMAKLTWCGHACFLIESDSRAVLIDPFLTGNPLAGLSVDQVPKVAAILLTHGHGDHLGDAIEIAKRDHAPVIATFELATYCESQGTQSVPMNIGGSYDLGWCSVKLVPAWHSSSIQTNDGVLYAGMPTGVLLKIDGKTLYHLGDTGLFGDLELIARVNGPIDVALVPIGDHFTMGISDAVEAWQLIQPRLVIPMHYNTFPPIRQDPTQFAERVCAKGGQVKVLKPGESVDL